MDKLEELERKYKELGIEIERLKRGNSVRWKPEEGQRYWYVNDIGDTTYVSFDNDEADNFRYINHNIFKTKQEAKEYRDYILARAEYVKEFTKEEWEDEHILKYYIVYNYNKLLIHTCWSTKSIGELNFESREKAQEFIDKYKKQILKYEFGVEV